MRRNKKNRVFSLFVLLIESGTLYVIMLVSCPPILVASLLNQPQIADLMLTSFVTGGPESVGRMIDCISGYSTVQFVVRPVYSSSPQIH